MQDKNLKTEFTRRFKKKSRADFKRQFQEKNSRKLFMGRY